jgi:formylmethanofuran dehydrogenase subunit D
MLGINSISEQPISSLPVIIGGVTYNISLSDTITLSDSVSKSVFLNESDSIVLSDAIAKAIGLSKSDSIVLSDAIVKAIGLSKSDSIVLSDAIAKAIGLSKSDSIVLSDAIAKAIGLSEADDIILSDAIAKAIFLIKEDNITLSDVIYVPGASNLVVNPPDVTKSDAGGRYRRSENEEERERIRQILQDDEIIMTSIQIWLKHLN